MMTTLYDQMPEKKDVVGGLMGLPPVSDPMKSDQGKEALTPMSQVSTAPSTPALCALLPESSLGYDSDSLCSWSRQSSCDDAEVSPAAFTSAATSRSLATAPSLGAIEEELEEVQALLQRKIAQEIDSEEDVDSEEVEMEWVTSGQFHLGQTAQGLVTLSTLEEKLGEVRNLYKEKYGQDVDSESDIEVDLIDQDGTPWTCTVGSGLTVAALENKLEELKTLYREKYDQHVDSESDHEDDLIDEDGTPWICTPGSGLLTIAVLHEKLDEVKHLYEKKFGENVDSEIECDLLDSDGTPWMCTVASGPATMGALEERLEVLKNKYREKYGQDVDSESESDDDLVDEDGTPWICTIGSGPATIDALEEKLDELKSLYKGKFGQDVDSESECDLLDSDGTPWICTVGNGAATMNVLEEKLEEVKNLYMHKYGQDVDSDSESECDLVDEDGTPWKCTVGCGPATIDVLEEKLEEVKNMYKEKYGQDVDSESEIECDLLDSDGTPWIGTVGCGPVTMSVLEGKLDEVRSLYKEKYGQDVDSESDSEGDLVDPDGTPWICTIGSGPATMDALEEKLDELKSLYKGKYGRDVDSESEIECDLLDSDGTPWICTVGSGPATIEALEEELDKVKNMYLEKYGRDVDNESESEYDLLDSDGTPWIGTVGCGPATFDALERKLDGVKTLYMEKYGEDVDSESEIECDLLDSDGTPWIGTIGCGPTTMDRLEKRLCEVKKLYMEKYGQDVDNESEIDCDLLDSDGTPWIGTYGSGPATVSALEEKLDTVKKLYREKYGQDVDVDSQYACANQLVDEDGTPWTCTEGKGLVTITLLEEKLSVLKNMYKEKYGSDVATDSDDEDQ